MKEFVNKLSSLGIRVVYKVERMKDVMKIIVVFTKADDKKSG